MVGAMLFYGISDMKARCPTQIQIIWQILTRNFSKRQIITSSWRGGIEISKADDFFGYFRIWIVYLIYGRKYFLMNQNPLQSVGVKQITCRENPYDYISNNNSDTHQYDFLYLNTFIYFNATPTLC